MCEMPTHVVFCVFTNIGLLKKKSPVIIQCAIEKTVCVLSNASGFVLQQKPIVKSVSYNLINCLCVCVS